MEKLYLEGKDPTYLDVHIHAAIVSTGKSKLAPTSLVSSS